MAMEKMKQEFDDLKKELKQMKEVEKELEHKSIDHDNEISALKAD